MKVLRAIARRDRCASFSSGSSVSRRLHTAFFLFSACSAQLVPLSRRGNRRQHVKVVALQAQTDGQWPWAVQIQRQGLSAFVLFKKYQ
jgi:hypothetical protein